jgi:hypothetical protein
MAKALEAKMKAGGGSNIRKPAALLNVKVSIMANGVAIVMKSINHANAMKSVISK